MHMLRGLLAWLSQRHVHLLSKRLETSHKDVDTHNAFCRDGENVGAFEKNE